MPTITVKSLEGLRAFKDFGTINTSGEYKDLNIELDTNENISDIVVEHFEFDAPPNKKIVGGNISLKISNAAITAEQAEGALPILHELLNSGRLNSIELHLRDTNILAKDVLSILKTLKANPAIRIEELDFGEELYLDRSNIGPEAMTLAKGLMTNTTLQLLGLDGNNFGPEGAMAIAAMLISNSTLQTLWFSRNNIGPNGARAIAEALKKNLALKILSLYRDNIELRGTNFIAEALTENTVLEVLDLGGNNIGSNGAKAIARALEKNVALQELQLRENDIDSQGVNFIAGSLVKNNILKVLNLEMNNINLEGISSIARMLMISTTLQEVQLGGNDIGPNGAKEIAEMLKVNFALRKLSIQKSNIDATGATEIAEALIENVSLQELDLDGNDIGSRGAARIAEALNANTTLRKLVLSRNSIDMGGAIEIASTLKNNNVLQVLDLSGNRIDSDGVTAIVTALRENVTLQELHLYGSAINEEGEQFKDHLLSINRFLHENFHYLSIAKRKEVKEVIMAYLGDRNLRKSIGEISQEELVGLMQHIRGEFSDLFVVENIEFGISKAVLGETLSKNPGEIAEEAEENFVAISSSNICNNRYKAYLAQKMFHIYQNLAEKYEEHAAYAKGKSILCLAYCYGSKLAANSAGEERIAVDDLSFEDIKMLLKATIVENLMGGETKVSYGRFAEDAVSGKRVFVQDPEGLAVSASYREFMDVEENRNRAIEFFMNLIREQGSWITKEQETAIISATMHLFAEEAMDTALDNQQRRIENTKEALSQFDKSKEDTWRNKERISALTDHKKLLERNRGHVSAGIEMRLEEDIKEVENRIQAYKDGPRQLGKNMKMGNFDIAEAERFNQYSCC